MNVNSLIVEPAGEEDLPEVLALSMLIQPHLQRSIDLLRWQYLRSPGQNSRLYLARDRHDRQLVAIYGAVSQVLQVGTSRMGAWMIQDVMTHPEHRGNGYLHMLARHCLAEMKRLQVTGYTFPNERSHNSFARTGWDRVDLIPSREATISGPPSSTPTPLSPCVDSGLTGAEAIWSESGLGLGVARDASFLSWRYSKPGQSYLLFCDDRDYFIALKLFAASGGDIVHVLDLFTRETARARVPELLAACLHFGARHSAVRATAWLPADHAYAQDFEAAGFRLNQRPERFFYVDFPESVSIPRTFWHLTQGDSDVY